MNQKLDFDAIKGLHRALSGYTGSIDDLQRCVQAASSQHEQRRFLRALVAMTSRAFSEAVGEVIDRLSRRFSDIGFRFDEQGPFSGLVVMDGPIAAAGPQPAGVRRCSDLVLRFRQKSSRSGGGAMEVFVRVYDGKNEPRRTRTLSFPLPESD